MSTNTVAPKRTRILAFGSWLLSTVALFLLALAGWIRFHFGAVSFEQIITNLPISNGEGVGNDELLVEAIVVCLVIPIALTTGFALWRRWRRTHQRSSRRRLGLHVIAVTAALAVLFAVAGVPQYAAAMLDKRTIDDYYLSPTTTSTPKRPLNLVTIYLESTENTFRDESIFGENLLANLDSATAGWATYPNLQQYPTGGWTMSGIVGTQCGIPLKSKLLTLGVNSNNQGERMEEYLPGATCLGDVLARNGYTNAFVGGANVRFGGKDTYLSDHGYTSIEGREKWEANAEPPENIGIWGISDQSLFSHARQTLDELHAESEPFNLTILTLDTHEPESIYPSCLPAKEEVRMATTLKCSGKAVAGFLNYLGDQGYLEDTVVMVMGDHIKNTGDSDQFRSELERAKSRTIFFAVHSPNPVHYSRENADQLSVLPTTLELLGFGLPNGPHWASPSSVTTASMGPPWAWESAPMKR